MFKATLVKAYHFRCPFTNGKEYEVIDFNDWNGTYTVLDDNGERKCVDWFRFADQGRAAEEYQRRRRSDGLEII